MKKNDDFDLTITGYTSEGNGVGKKDGIAVFVENTAKNDVIKCHIIKAKKNYAVGKAMKIIKPSKDRIIPECEHFRYCGGCSFSHLKYEAEAQLKAEKVKDAFLRIAHLEPDFEEIIASADTTRYRNKAQYPVRRENGILKIGFYAKKSHRVIDGDDCLLQPEEFGEIVEIFRKFINNNNIPVYSEELHVGLIRHIYLRKAFKTNEIMVCVVINGDTLKNSAELIENLKSIDGFKTLILNKNKEKTNVVLGNECETLFGDGFITDILCGVKVKLSPLSFYQVNHDTAELLYNKAKEYASLTPNDDFLDLYCGTGTIGLSMAKEAKSLIGVEIIPDAIEDAKLNAELNGITNAEFICGDAKDAVKELQQRNITPKVVILDPPRKGCSEELLKTVAEIGPERIVYVSCDPATLARDAGRLLTLGYETKKVTPVDMFPRTSHVETVALLSRQKVDEHIYLDVNVQDLPKTTRTTATYPEIKAYIKDKYGLNVTSLNIAQIKEKHGFEKRENYNKGKEGHRVPNCPPEKEKAIEDAFKHFGML
ncbi:MAG: 23S rRNA (uracil(1939)-C(5))-methyltransferase RlmD [Clostridia bacterium]|nr:23S rRNA (uracil(1939)-C(5))-methyltransferase RlmD [Clostridia bacterium]